VGDLLDREVDQVVEDQYLALADRQGAQRLGQRERLGRGRQDLRWRRELEQRFGLAAQAAGAVGDEVHRHPTDPRFWHVVVAQP
jgi:hypothetical protein